VLAAFFLGLGIGAHSLDETMGNPLKTRLSKKTLYLIGFGALATSIANWYSLCPVSITDPPSLRIDRIVLQSPTI